MDQEVISTDPLAVNKYKLWLKCKRQLVKDPGM